MTPYELILSETIFPHIRYIRKYGVYTVIYGVYTVYGDPMYGLGQPNIFVCARASLCAVGFHFHLCLLARRTHISIFNGALIHTTITLLP